MIYDSDIKFYTALVYEYYDRPILFTCHTPSVFSYFADKMYLGILIDDGHDDGGYWEAFMYVEVSSDRIVQFHDNKIEIRDMFLEAESGSVFVVLELPNNKKVLDNWRCDTIPDELLSLPGIYLSKEASTTQV